MKLKINPSSLRQITFITAIDDYGPRRRYYDVAGILVVCQNNLELADLKNLVVDATSGLDTAQPGFTVYEHQIGQRRAKVTIFRVLNARRAETSLSAQIARAKKKGLVLDNFPPVA